MLSTNVEYTQVFDTEINDFIRCIETLLIFTATRFPRNKLQTLSSRYQWKFPGGRIKTIATYRRIFQKKIDWKSKGANIKIGGGTI